MYYCDYKQNILKEIAKEVYRVLSSNCEKCRARQQTCPGYWYQYFTDQIRRRGDVK